MSTKPSKRVVSLSVHKNTLERHKKRQLAKDFTEQVALLIKSRNVKTAAFIGIDDTDGWVAVFKADAGIPELALPAIAQTILLMALEKKASQGGMSDDI